MTSIAGIFVGGASSRMGGRPKGLLEVPVTREKIVVKLVRIAREADLEPMLVGDATHYRPIAPGVPILPDEPPGMGPLGGLAALLAAARDRPAIALACDMPYVTRELVARLATARADGPVLAARAADDAARWEPFFARYDSSRVRSALEGVLARGERSMHALLASVRVDELVLTDDERTTLRDWDSPSDVDTP